VSRRTIVSRAPTRIDLGGGWTDVARYALDAPGAVLNVAISLWASVTVRSRDEDSTVTIRSLDFEETVTAPSAEALAFDGTLDLLKGAVRRLDPGVGVEVEARSLAPPGSGLGTSAAVCVALLGALNRLADRGLSRRDLAELACSIEQDDLGILGGKQDQYASAFGGAAFLTFDGPSVSRESLALPPDLADELHRRLVLCYTGKSRLSGDIHDHVRAAFSADEPATVGAIADLKRLTREMGIRLDASDLAGVGRLLIDHWEAQKRLHPSVTNAQIDRLFEAAAANGSLGGKACGAGGGGCLVFLAEAGRERLLRRALAAEGVAILDFVFDPDGVVSRSAPRSP